MVELNESESGSRAIEKLWITSFLFTSYFTINFIMKISNSQFHRYF